MAEPASDKWVYGSLKLANVRTTAYRQDAVTTSDGVDVVAVKHTVTVSGTLSPGAVPAESSEVGSDVLARLRFYFRHRRYFLYAVGGRKVVEVGNTAAPNDPAQNLDAANGPKILNVVVNLVTDYSVSVEVTIEATTIPCTAADRVILSHRFSQSHSTDESGYLSVSTTGTIYLRSDKRVSFVDVLRTAGMPRVQNGFQRIDQRAGISSDGLTVEYSMSDKEYFIGPPTEASQCKIKTSVAQQNSAKVYASTNVFLRGKRDSTIQPDAFFRRLIERATLIADIQLRPYRLLIDGRVDMPSVTIEKDITEGTVSVYIQAIADPKKIQGNGRLDFEILGRSGVLVQTGLAQLGVKPIGPDWSDSGTRIAEAFHAAFQEPCGELFILPTTPKKYEGPLQSDDKVNGSQFGSTGSDEFDGGVLTGGGTGIPPGFGGGVLTGGGGGDPLPPTPDIYQFPPVIDGGPQVVPASTDPASSPVVELTGGSTNGVSNTGGNTVGNFAGTSTGVTSESYTTRTTEQRVPYEVCVFVCDTVVNEGVTVVPSSARPTVKTDGTIVYPPAIKVRQHQPCGHLTIKWTLKRSGVRPLAPDPIPPEAAGLVLLSREIGEVNVDQHPSGQFVFELTGVYRYAYLDASKAREVNALGPLIINDYLRSPHAREATIGQPVSLWHTWLNLDGLAANAKGQILKPTQPPKTDPPANGTA